MPHHFIDVAVWKRYKHWASNQMSVDRYPRRARGRPAAKEPKEGVEGLDISMLMVVPAK